MKYHIQKIEDGYRPEFPKAGFLVYSNNSPHGWLHCLWFKTREDADEYAKTLEGKPDENI